MYDNYLILDYETRCRLAKLLFNSTLAIGGDSSPLDSFEVAESSVLRIKFGANNPAHRQSAKRYQRVDYRPQNA